MGFKFEKLEVWNLALEYSDLVYIVANKLPHSEEYNLKSQLVRAATSIALNIAEGSTSQSDAEFGRFLGMAIRSLVETVACLRLIERRKYAESDSLQEISVAGERLFAKLQALRKTVAGS